MAVAAYPGSFDPPTIAHLAIAEAAVRQLDLDRLDLIISMDPLGKDRDRQVRLHDRLAVLEAVAAERPWMQVRTTRDRLVTEIAAGYDVIVVGADKWVQVLDPRWYGGSTEARDRAVAALGTVALAPRAIEAAPSPPGAPRGLPSLAVVELDLHLSHRSVSATSVRSGRREWMAGAAAAFDERSGAWSDADRYRQWIRANPAPDPEIDPPGGG